MIPVNDNFPDEQLLALHVHEPWYADYVNYLVSNMIPLHFTSDQKRKFKKDVKNYMWDDPLLVENLSR